MAVEKIQKIGAKLQAELFLEMEVLHERQVFADDAEVAGLCVGVGGGSERQRRRIREDRLIQIRILRRPLIDDIEASFIKAGRLHVAGSYIGAVHGAVPEARQRRSARNKSKRGTAAVLQDRGERPPAEDGRNGFVGAAQQSLSPTDRDLVNRE